MTSTDNQKIIPSDPAILEKDAEPSSVPKSSEQIEAEWAENIRLLMEQLEDDLCH